MNIPVNRIVNIWPDMCVWQNDTVGGRKIISHHFKHSKHDMEAENKKHDINHFIYRIVPVSHIESCEEVVKTIAPHILGVEDNDAEEVANQPKTTKCFKRFTIVKMFSFF